MTKIIMLFVVLGLYLEIAKEWVTDPTAYYFGANPWVLPDGTTYDKYEKLPELYKDAYNMVFFSVGLCVGVFTTYGSYRKIREPVIMTSFFIGIMDFLYSVTSSWVIWAALAVLTSKKDDAAGQTSATGLVFIAMPRLAEVTCYVKTYTLFCVWLWFSGIDSAVSYVMAHMETRKRSQPDMPYAGFAFEICLKGVGLSMLFCTNWGWILFDLVDHYLSDYCIILIGLL